MTTKMTYQQEIRFCQAIWDEAEELYDDGIRAFRRLPTWMTEPDPTHKTIQYRIKIANDECFWRKGLAQSPLTHMDWFAPSIDFKIVPQHIQKQLFALIRT